MKTMDNSFSVDVFRCEEANVYVGTSGDIPGLTLESDTLGGLLEAALEMVPQLIEQNLELPENSDVQVTVRVRHPLRETDRVRRQNARSPSSPKPRFIVEEELSLTHA